MLYANKVPRQSAQPCKALRCNEELCTGAQTAVGLCNEELCTDAQTAVGLCNEELCTDAQTAVGLFAYNKMPFLSGLSSTIMSAGALETLYFMTQLNFLSFKYTTLNLTFNLSAKTNSLPKF